MNQGKTRSSLLGIVGAYLLYTAYELFEGRGDPNTTMTPAIRILFIAFFALAGAAILVYAWRVWKNSGKEEKEEPPKEDDNTLK